MMLLLKVVIVMLGLAFLVPVIFFLSYFLYWMWDEMAGIVKGWLSR
jgi:hypothetical protein